MTTVQESIQRILSEEPDGPVAHALLPLSMPMVIESIERGEWDHFVEVVEALKARAAEGTEKMVEGVLNRIVEEKKLDLFLKAFEAESTRPLVEPAMKLMGQRLVPSLTSMVRTHPNRGARRAAAVLLKQLNPASWKIILNAIGMTAAKEECLNVLEVATILVDDLLAAGPALLPLADHKEPEVVGRLLAIGAALGPRTLAEVARKALMRKEEALVVRSLQIATEQKLKDLAAWIAGLLKREITDEIALACCRYLQKFPTPAALDALLAIGTEKAGLLGGRHKFGPEVRAEAILALAYFATPDAEAAMQAGLKDKEPLVRAAAKRAVDLHDALLKRAPPSMTSRRLQPPPTQPPK
jgi:hypothetical protein